MLMETYVYGSKPESIIVGKYAYALKDGTSEGQITVCDDGASVRDLHACHMLTIISTNK